MNPTQLVAKHPHIFGLASDGVLEMYCDHHILSTLRTCEAKFYEEQLAHIGTKTSRYFSLEFGTWLHEVLDNYYQVFKEYQIPPALDAWVAEGLLLWDKYKLDDFAPPPGQLTKDMYGDAKKYYSFAKWDPRGAVTHLLIQYYAYYMNQRMRVVDTEISFGRAREVPLGTLAIPVVLPSLQPGYHLEFDCEMAPVRCYLTGRIDLLVDNGAKIGPVDHKSTARFDGYESNDFDPHEGITGYIYAINSILRAQSESESIARMSGDSPSIPTLCNSGWIYHISLQDSEPRFKPTPIYKTNQQLEEYRLRQLRAFRRIYELAATTETLENYGAFEMSTDKCNNIYNSPCPFRELHRQPFGQREATVQQFYQIREAWNPASPPRVKAT